MKNLKYYLILISALFPITAFAQIPSLVPECAKQGKMELTCFLELFVNVGNLLFGIAGAVALAIFVWGGVQYILAAGSQEKVKKATSTLVNGVIGLLIILGAYLIVSSIIFLLTGKTLIDIAPQDIKQFLR